MTNQLRKTAPVGLLSLLLLIGLQSAWSQPVVLASATGHKQLPELARQHDVETLPGQFSEVPLPVG